MSGASIIEEHGGMDMRVVNEESIRGYANIQLGDNANPDDISDDDVKDFLKRELPKTDQAGLTPIGSVSDIDDITVSGRQVLNGNVLRVDFDILPTQDAMDDYMAGSLGREAQTTWGELAYHPRLARKLRGLTQEAKAAIWTKTDRIATSWEKRFSDAAAKQLEHDKREVLALLSDAKRKSLERKATVDWQDYLLSVQDYLETAGDEAWRKMFVPLMRGVMTAQGESLSADFGMQFDVRNLFAEAWFDEYMLKFAQPINATTSDDISRLQQTAMEQGWSIPDMQKALGALFGQYLNGGGLTDEERAWFENRTPAYRRENIARTETIRASNAGSFALYRDWGANQKEWYSTHDDRTRPEHRVGEAWGKPALVVDMEKPFHIGGERLMYPGDPSGSPANTCQCRCTVLPAGI
jgi:hypothetical protein